MLEYSNGAFVDPIPNFDSVTVALWVASGSRDEDLEARGTAHFLEHLVTTTRVGAAGNIFQLCDSLGGRSEAVTTPEFTLYAATLPGSHFVEGWALLQDQFLAPDFTTSHVEAERSAVLDEIAGIHADHGRLIHELALEDLFGSHPLGYPARGWSTDIRGLKADRVKDQHQRQLGSRFVPIVSGGVDPDEARNTFAASILSSRQEASLRMDSAPSRTLAYAGEQRRPVSSSRSHVLLTWVLPERVPSDDFALSIVNRLIGGSSAGVLQQAFSGMEGEYSCYTYRSVFSDCAILSAYVSCSAEAIEESVERIRTSVRLAWHGVLLKQEALDRASRALKGSLAIGLESTRMRVNWLGRAMMDCAADPDAVIARGMSAQGAVTVGEVSSLCERLEGPHVTILEGTEKK